MWRPLFLLALQLLLPLVSAQRPQEGIEGLYRSPLLICPNDGGGGGGGCIDPTAAGAAGAGGAGATSAPGPGAVLSVAWDTGRNGYVLLQEGAAGGKLAGDGEDRVLLANATAADGALCVCD